MNGFICIQGALPFYLVQLPPGRPPVIQYEYMHTTIIQFTKNDKILRINNLCVIIIDK